MDFTYIHAQYTQIDTHVYTHTLKYKYMHIYTYAPTNIHTYIHTYTYISYPSFKFKEFQTRDFLDFITKGTVPNIGVLYLTQILWHFASLTYIIYLFD